MRKEKRWWGEGVVGGSAWSLFPLHSGSSFLRAGGRGWRRGCRGRRGRANADTGRHGQKRGRGRHGQRRDEDCSEADAEAGPTTIRMVSNRLGSWELGRHGVGSVLSGPVGRRSLWNKVEMLAGSDRDRAVPRTEGQERRGPWINYMAPLPPPLSSYKGGAAAEAGIGRKHWRRDSEGGILEETRSRRRMGVGLAVRKLELWKREKVVAREGGPWEAEAEAGRPTPMREAEAEAGGRRGR